VFCTAAQLGRYHPNVIQFGLTATVREILATDNPTVSIAHARADDPNYIQVDVRIRYHNETHPVKIGDLVDLTGTLMPCQLTPVAAAALTARQPAPTAAVAPTGV